MSTSRRTRLARRSSSGSIRRLGHRVDRRAREARAEHREVADERALVRRQPVEAGDEQGGEGRRAPRGRRASRRGGAGVVGVSTRPRSIERSDDLDGVERDALGLADDRARPRRSGRSTRSSSSRSIDVPSSGSRPMLVPLRRWPQPGGARPARVGPGSGRRWGGPPTSRGGCRGSRAARRRPTAGRRSP